MTDSTTTRRHRWDKPMRFPHKTERACRFCGLVKVTRHEPGERPWQEFYRGLERVMCERTPACEPAEARAA